MRLHISLFPGMNKLDCSRMTNFLGKWQMSSITSLCCYTRAPIYAKRVHTKVFCTVCAKVAKEAKASVHSFWLLSMLLKLKNNPSMNCHIHLSGSWLQHPWDLSTRGAGMRQRQTKWKLWQQQQQKLSDWQIQHGEVLLESSVIYNYLLFQTEPVSPWIEEVAFVCATRSPDNASSHLGLFCYFPLNHPLFFLTISYICCGSQPSTAILL